MPGGASAVPVMPPGTFGGNMDTRQLVEGATLFLPVQVENALFSVGDVHGCQGDGEVCVTGLESPMYASLRFTLEKGRTLPSPQYRTPAPLTPRVDTAPFYGTTGVGPDLFVCAQDSIRAMVDHISTTYDLSRQDAYVLCSLCVDLKISEVVDAGQYVVSALLPEAASCARESARPCRHCAARRSAAVGVGRSGRTAYRPSATTWLEVPWSSIRSGRGEPRLERGGGLPQPAARRAR